MYAASLTCVFTGPGALHVLTKQGLPENHLPQLEARLQRGADHVLLAGGTEGCGGVADTAWPFLFVDFKELHNSVWECS